MSLLTSWGYELTDVDALRNLIDASDFDDFTASRYKGDERINSNLTAVSAAIRNYCGWHVYPSLRCKLAATFYDPRVTAFSDGVMIQLPATYVSDVESVSIAGKDHETYICETNGILRIYGVHASCFQPFDRIEIIYTAGLPDQLAGSVRELAAHRITHALASSNGVTSESTGGVSITYNANWINSARSTALPDDNKEVLSPYRLRGVF